MRADSERMPRKTTFVTSWLLPHMKDKNGNVVSDWCTEQKNNNEFAFCKACNKSFSISNMGFRQILHHADGEKHKAYMKAKQGQSIFKVMHIDKPQLIAEKKQEDVNVDEESTNANSRPNAGGNMQNDLVLAISNSKCTKKWMPINLDDKIKKAEILLTLKLVASNYSFNSFSDICDIFKAAFVDSEIAQHMELRCTKVAYLLEYGIAPFFQSQFLKDCRNGVGYLHCISIKQPQDK